MMIAANIISMTILFAVPLLLVAMGGMFSEHSGVINIALEGMMIIGALFACFTLQGLDQSGFGPAHPQLSMFIAILVAGVTGMIFSLLLGLRHHEVLMGIRPAPDQAERAGIIQDSIELFLLRYALP